MTIHYLIGDATNPVGEGNKLIIHICNNRGGWGKGFVTAISKKWKKPEMDYRFFMNLPDLIADDQLGVCRAVQVEENIWVISMIAQSGYKSVYNPVPLNYDALKACLYSVFNKAKEFDATVHAPRIGCGLAGGEWSKVEELLIDVLENIDVYIYDLE